MATYLRMLLRVPMQSDNSFSMIRAAAEVTDQRSFDASSWERPVPQVH